MNGIRMNVYKKLLKEIGTLEGLEKVNIPNIYVEVCQDLGL